MSQQIIMPLERSIERAMVWPMGRCQRCYLRKGHKAARSTHLRGAIATLGEVVRAFKDHVPGPLAGGRDS